MTVQFAFTGWRRGNKVVVTLNDGDLYDVAFWKVGRGACAQVHTVTDVGAANLARTFEVVTGLALSL